MRLVIIVLCLMVCSLCYGIDYNWGVDGDAITYEFDGARECLRIGTISVITKDPKDCRVEVVDDSDILEVNNLRYNETEGHLLIMKENSIWILLYSDNYLEWKVRRIVPDTNLTYGAITYLTIYEYENVYERED